MDERGEERASEVEGRTERADERAGGAKGSAARQRNEPHVQTLVAQDVPLKMLGVSRCASAESCARKRAGAVCASLDAHGVASAPLDLLVLSFSLHVKAS